MLSFTTLTSAIFFVLNSLGQIPLFLAILSPYEYRKQQKIIFRELFIALVLLWLFIFFGNWILSVIGIDRSIIGISGGILLFIISLTMIFPKNNKKEGGLPRHEPLIVPLAIPVIAGPGSIATVMVYAEKTQRPFFVAAAAVVAWIFSLVVLLSASYLKRFMGERGLHALERLGGMIVSLIGVQMFAKGIIELVKKNFF